MYSRTLPLVRKCHLHIAHITALQSAMYHCAATCAATRNAANTPTVGLECRSSTGLCMLQGRICCELAEFRLSYSHMASAPCSMRRLCCWNIWLQLPAKTTVSLEKSWMRHGLLASVTAICVSMRGSATQRSSGGCGSTPQSPASPLPGTMTNADDVCKQASLQNETSVCRAFSLFGKTNRRGSCLEFYKQGAACKLEALAGRASVHT